MITIGFVTGFVLHCHEAAAQFETYAESGLPPEIGLTLLQEEAHDIIYFAEAKGGGWVKVLPLPFPNRKLPASPSGSLVFKIMEIEGKDFAAKWSDIEKIDLWEVRLEREAKERVVKGDFAGAYPFISVLIRDYPNRPGLREMRSEFLWKEALSRASQKDRGATLGMLEELRRYNPEYKRSTVLDAIGKTTNSVLTTLVEDGKLDNAQRMLARLEKEYDTLASIKIWNAKFLKMATDKRNLALAAARKKDFRSARQLARESVYLKPDIPGGQELIDKIDEIYPLINVGVLQSATVFEPTRLDNWAARRTGRLLYRTMFEIKDAGPEGGEYDFIFGETSINPGRTEYDLILETDKLPEPLNQVNGFFLADVLAKRVNAKDPLYFSPWAASVTGIGLNGPQQIQCTLRRPHVFAQLPAANPR